MDWVFLDMPVYFEEDSMIQMCLVDVSCVWILFLVAAVSNSARMKKKKIISYFY